MKEFLEGFNKGQEENKQGIQMLACFSNC